MMKIRIYPKNLQDIACLQRVMELHPELSFQLNSLSSSRGSILALVWNFCKPSGDKLIIVCGERKNIHIFLKDLKKLNISFECTIKTLLSRHRFK